MTRYSSLLLLGVAALFTVDAFAPASVSINLRQSASCLTPVSMAVVDIDGEAAFDKTIKNAGDSLVIVDYSTTWWGKREIFFSWVCYQGLELGYLYRFVRILFCSNFFDRFPTGISCSCPGVVLVRSVKWSGLPSSWLKPQLCIFIPVLADPHFFCFPHHLQVIAPKFDEFSEKYPDAVFLKVCSGHI